jgi:hypothetical protein
MGQFFFGFGSLKSLCACKVSVVPVAYFVKSNLNSLLELLGGVVAFPHVWVLALAVFYLSDRSLLN